MTSYHFIGIGGIGMSGLAELLVRQGHQVSGSDAAESPITRRLQDLGVRIFAGHRAEHLGEARVVVHTTAVKEDNPELAAARALGREILRRGQMQARLMEGYLPGGRHRGPRQDLHHRHGGRGPAGRGPGPLGPGGRGLGQPRQQRRAGPGEIILWPRPTRATALLPI
jgi:hypothetical protein